MQQSSQVAPHAAPQRAPGMASSGAVPADAASAALAAVAAPGAERIVIDRNLLLQGIALQNEGKLEHAQTNRKSVGRWSKYSSGAAIISKQTAEALATADTTARRVRQRGREEE